MIAASPAWWPYVSLINLKWSMSRHDQAARQLRFLMGGNEIVEHPVEFGAIGDLRQRVFGDLGVERLALFFERRFGRGVVQQHRRALQHAVVAADGNRVQVDRHILALAAHDVDAANRLNAALHRAGDGAFFVRDASLVGIVHVEQAGQKRATAGGAAADAGEPLGARCSKAGSVEWTSTNNTPSCMLSISFFSNNASGHSTSLAGAIADGGRQFPRQRAAGALQRVEPAAGQSLGEQVLVLRKQLAELLHELWIELPAGTLEQLGQRPFARASRTIDVIGRHRVEGIDDRQHAGGQRNLCAALIRTAARAVEAGSRAADDFQDVFGHAAAGQDLDRHGRVPVHDVDFFRQQAARLMKHLVGDADLADVVKQRGDFEQVASFRVELQHRRPRAAAQRHTQTVGGRRRMLAAQRGVEAAGNSEAALNELGFLAIGALRRGGPAADRGCFVERVK